MKPNHQPERRRGIARDMDVLSSGGKATAEELREFMQQMKGRNPQEVLGIVAQSGLFQGILMATLGTVAFLFLFTVGPYAWSKAVGKPDKKVAEAKAADAKAADAKAADKKDDKKDDKGGKGKADSGEEKPDVARAAKVLGTNDKKSGAPDIDALMDASKKE